MNWKLFCVLSVVLGILFLLIFQSIAAVIGVTIAILLSGFLIWIVGKMGERKYYYLFKG